MATTLDTLQVIIQGNVKGLVDAFSTATKATKSFAGGVEKHTQAVRVGLNKVGYVATGIVAPLAAAAAAFASFKAVMESFEKADSAGRTAAQLGITVENLQKLSYAAELSQSSGAELSRGLQKMSIFLGEASKYGSESQRTLQKLGLTLEDFEGMTADEAFGKLSDRLKDVTSGGDRAAIGMKIFGETSGKMVGLINLGSEGMRELGDEGERTGRVMSKVDFAKVIAAKDSVEKMGTAFSALSDRIAVSLAPVIDWIANGINEWIGDTKRFDETFQSVAKGIVGAIGIIRTTWDGLTLLWESAKIVVGALSIAFWEAVRGITKAVMFVWGVISNWYEACQNGFKVVAAALVVGWEAIKYAGIQAFAAVEIAFGKTIRAMGEAAGASGLDVFGDVATKAANAGAALEIAGNKLKKAAGSEMKMAVDDLKNASEEFGASVKKLGEMPDVKTEKLDRLVGQAHNFYNASVDGVKKLSAEIASQVGGNAFSASFASYENSVKASQGRIDEIVKTSGATRAIVDKNAVEASKTNLEDLAATYKSAYDLIAGIQAASLAASDKLTGGHKVADDEYSSKLAQLQSFLDQKIIKQETYDRMSQKLTAQHGLDTMAAESELQKQQMGAIINHAGATYKQKMEAYDGLLNAEIENNAARMAIATANHDAGIVTDQEYASISEQAMLDHQMNLTAIHASQSQMRQQAEQMTLGAMAGMFGSFAAAMDQSKKKEFNAWKAFSIAQALITTWMSATMAYYSAMAFGMPPWLAWTQSAMAVAGGLANVYKIASTQFGGGAGAGGGISGGASASSSSSSGGASGGNVGNNSNVNVSLYGSNFSADQVRGLISAINEQAGDNMTLKTQVMG